MRQEADCFKCGSFNVLVTCSDDPKIGLFGLLGMVCVDCGHVACCTNCGAWEDDNGVINHKDYCIDKDN